MLIGTNPRFEATILNSRIRKAYLSNKTEIYSLGDVGDLTYPYKVLDKSTKTIKDICNSTHKISEIVNKSKKPLFIIGQSALKIKSSTYIFEEIKKFLIAKNKINEEWNALNILSNHASTVGSYDLKIISSNDGSNKTIDKIKKNELEVIFLFGQDNLKFNKKNEFIIYIGSHGDAGANIADIILPGATYTEQDGYFTNLEGKLQKSYKASYPPGEAKEDWIIVNELAASIKRKKLFTDQDDLINNMFNFLKLNQNNKNYKIPNYEFFNENIEVDKVDYYYTNVIARASNTMTECRNLRENFKKTGTEGW